MATGRKPAKRTTKKTARTGIAGLSTGEGSSPTTPFRKAMRRRTGAAISPAELTDKAIRRLTGAALTSEESRLLGGLRAKAKVWAKAKKAKKRK